MTVSQASDKFTTYDRGATTLNYRSDINDASDFIECDPLSKDHQQQILDLNTRQLRPKILKDNSFNKVFSAALGDRIIINNFPSSPAHSSSNFCDKVSIEIISVSKNSVDLRLTISNNAFIIEKELPAKS